MESGLLRRVFPGENETARRLRDLDWNTHELGTPDSWPENLQSAIAICLASRMPMQVWWGAERLLFYNDASIELLPARHPSALARSGRDAFGAELWSTIEPAIERVFDGNETTWCEGVRMLVERRIPGEEVYTTFSFAPISGEGGGVDGVLATCVDVTDNVISARRLGVLHRLGTAVASVRSLDAAAKLLASVLRDCPDVPYAVLYIAEGGTARAHTWINTSEDASGLPSVAGEGELGHVLETEEPADLTLRDGHALALPIRGAHGVVGVLVCGIGPHLPLDVAYRSFLELVTTHVSSALSDGQNVPARQPSDAPASQLPAKDAFLSIVAHELRNPLSALLTTLQALMLRTPTSEVELMERSVRQVARVVDNLLDVSRIARGRLELRTKPNELANIVDRAMELATPMIEQQRTQVFVRIPRAGLRLEVDGERVAQALANLLTNAARFSEPGARVWVQATRELGRMKIIVKDEGAGIEPEQMPAIFEAFYQAPETRPRTAGLGLGLAIARSLIEMHGGTLRITSGGNGHGTECVVELPVEAQLATPVLPVSGAPATRRRLLLVEDNDDTARALKSALEQLGYVVALAHNGPVALNVARTFDPDVVLMDIGLPVMDGWELARRLRALRGAIQDAPVVAVTAYDRDGDKQKSADAGFVEHLVKPIDLARLQQLVESLPLRSA
jgi:signal transduction histidine kinase